MSSKVALITGGARGIGRAVALDLAAQGWSIAICYRTSAQEAGEVPLLEHEHQRAVAGQDTQRVHRDRLQRQHHRAK